jgi:hypothetical protein
MDRGEVLASPDWEVLEAEVRGGEGGERERGGSNTWLKDHSIKIHVLMVLMEEFTKELSKGSGFEISTDQDMFLISSKSVHSSGPHRGTIHLLDENVGLLRDEGDGKDDNEHCHEAS